MAELRGAGGGGDGRCGVSDGAGAAGSDDDDAPPAFGRAPFRLRHRASALCVACAADGRAVLADGPGDEWALTPEIHQAVIWGP